MLNVEDPETGENLMIKISGFKSSRFNCLPRNDQLLSFAIYFLLKHPRVLDKAYEEADRVLTDPVPSYKQVLDLTYIRMILQESLRL